MTSYSGYAVNWKEATGQDDQLRKDKIWDLIMLSLVLLKLVPPDTNFFLCFMNTPADFVTKRTVQLQFSLAWFDIVGIIHCALEESADPCAAYFRGMVQAPAH